MIWIVLVLLVLAALGALAGPLLLAEASGGGDTELAQCRVALAKIEADRAAGRVSGEEAAGARAQIEARVLALARKVGAKTESPHASGRAILIGVALILLAGAGGLYHTFGMPDFQSQAVYLPGARLPSGEVATLETLAGQLSARIERDENSPVEAYVFLARTYWADDQREASLGVYELALREFGEVPGLLKEYQDMHAALAGRGIAPQISEQQRVAISEMSDEEQAAMIASMVDRLAARLVENPDDLTGWSGLIRARAVLRDEVAARADLAAAREVFAGDAAALAHLRAVAIEVGLEN